MLKLNDKVYTISGKKIKEWQISEINIKKYLVFN